MPQAAQSSAALYRQDCLHPYRAEQFASVSCRNGIHKFSTSPKMLSSRSSGHSHRSNFRTINIIHCHSQSKRQLAVLVCIRHLLRQQPAAKSFLRSEALGFDLLQTLMGLNSPPFWYRKKILGWKLFFLTSVKLWSHDILLIDFIC